MLVRLKLVAGLFMLSALFASQANAQGMVGIQSSNINLQGGQTATVNNDQLLANVLNALPTGTTFESATEAQIEAAVNAVIADSPGVADIATQVLSVAAVALDAVGRSAVSNTVTTNVVNAQPAAARAQITSAVTANRSNPTPGQVAATGSYLAGTLPSAGPLNSQQNQGGGIGAGSGLAGVLQQRTNNLAPGATGQVPVFNPITNLGGATGSSGPLLNQAAVTTQTPVVVITPGSNVSSPITPVIPPPFSGTLHLF